MSKMYRSEFDSVACNCYSDAVADYASHLRLRSTQVSCCRGDISSLSEKRVTILPMYNDNGMFQVCSIVEDNDGNIHSFIHYKCFASLDECEDLGVRIRESGMVDWEFLLDNPHWNEVE